MQFDIDYEPATQQSKALEQAKFDLINALSLIKAEYDKINSEQGIWDGTAAYKAKSALVELMEDCGKLTNAVVVADSNLRNAITNYQRLDNIGTSSN